MKSPRPGISPILVLLAALLFSAGVVVDLVTADEHSHKVSDFIQICLQFPRSFFLSRPGGSCPRIRSLKIPPPFNSTPEWEPRPPFFLRNEPGQDSLFENVFFSSPRQSGNPTSRLGCWTSRPPRSSSITLPTLAHFTSPLLFLLVLSKGGCHCLGEYSWAL